MSHGRTRDGRAHARNCRRAGAAVVALRDGCAVEGRADTSLPSNVVEAHRDLNLRTFSVEVADDRVVRSVYQRSVGYTYEALEIFMPAGAKQPVYALYREHVPPDTAAASLCLRNRRKDE